MVPLDSMVALLYTRLLFLRGEEADLGSGGSGGGAVLSEGGFGVGGSDGGGGGIEASSSAVLPLQNRYDYL